MYLAGDEWDEDDFNNDDDNGPNNNDDVLRDGDDIRELLKNSLWTQYYHRDFKMKRHMIYMINLLLCQVLHKITDNVLQF